MKPGDRMDGVGDFFKRPDFDIVYFHFNLKEIPPGAKQGVHSPDTGQPRAP